jgi:hypothetical protein
LTLHLREQINSKSFAHAQDDIAFV